MQKQNIHYVENLSSRNKRHLRRTKSLYYGDTKWRPNFYQANSLLVSVKLSLISNLSTIPMQDHTDDSDLHEAKCLHAFTVTWFYTLWQKFKDTLCFLQFYVLTSQPLNFCFTAYFHITFVLFNFAKKK